jgi:hypothetical protein
MFLLIAAFSTSGWAADEDVRASVERLHDWLGDNENASAWRRFLKTDELLAQVAGSEPPDRALVADALARFESSTAGLNHPEFTRVRNSLGQLAGRLSLTENERLAGVARMATGRFRPIDVGRRQAARTELVNALHDLDGYLIASGRANELRWKSYLKWDALTAQVRSDQPDPAVLNEIASQYFQGHTGLEEPKFVRVREAIVAYRWLTLAAESPEIPRTYDEQLGLLSNSIVSLDSDSSVIKTTEISNRLDWLSTLGQAPELVTRMRHRHDLPNLKVVVTEPLLARAMADRVDQVSPVSEMILDTHVRGTAHTVGQISANFAPSPQGAAIEVRLDGISTSDTIGFRHPVNVFSRGHTDVFGRSRILLDGARFEFDPATANCRTRTTIRSIRAVRGGVGQHLIERIARRRAAEQKPLSEQIASRRAERRIANMMNQRLQERIARANSRFESKVRTPLLRRNVYPRWLHLWSGEDTMEIVAMQGRANQFGSPTHAPPMPPHGLRIQLHESLAANSAVNYLAGLTLTDEAAVQVARELTGEVPESLKLRDDEDPWSITFDRQNPFVVIFRNDEVQFLIRGRRFTRGDQTLNRLIEISARYQMIPTGGRMRLVRQGEVQVVYPEREGQRLTISEITQRDFMRNKFGSLFDAEIVSDGIQPPERLRNVGSLQLRYAKADNGWLSLGWE